MKVIWNQRTSMPEFIMEEKDFMDAASIQEMVSGNFHCRKCGTINVNSAWSIIEGYFKSARESIIESMKIGLQENPLRYSPGLVKSF